MLMMVQSHTKRNFYFFWSRLGWRLSPNTIYFMAVIPDMGLADSWKDFDGVIPEPFFHGTVQPLIGCSRGIIFSTL